jgi:diguanylate cyclase (GGDEF)-like protein
MQENKLFEALLDVIPFAAYAVDIETYEVVYANKLMSENMYAPREEYCWKKIFGQEEVCSWCKISELKQRDRVYKSDKLVSSFFDESTDKWLQSYDELVRWPDGRTVKYSIAVDITEQKEIQANIIKTHTKLAMQTKKLKEANEKLEYMAKKDYLTGINNRGNFFSLGNKLLDEYIKNGKTLHAAMIDIDKFKNINDRYGHSIGDVVLKRFAQNIIEKLGENDLYGRLGGEEFAVLLPDQSEEEVLEKLEHLRDSTSKLDIDIDGDTIGFTISIGVDSLSKDDKMLDTLLDKADKQLYSAKGDGRDRVKFRGV